MAQKKRRRKAPAEPISMTQQEINAKARGLKKAEAVTRLIRREVPTKALGRLKTKALTPAPISLKEINAIQRAGKPSSALAKRLARASDADVVRRRTSRKRRKAVPRKKVSRGRTR